VRAVDGQSEAGRHSNLESRPETTATSRAIANGEDLAKIIEIGTHEQWLIKPEELRTKPDSVLGKGGFGKVVCGEFHGTPVAVKMTKVGAEEEADSGEGAEHKAAARTKMLISIYNEIRILRHVRHPNVVLFYGACLNSDRGDVKLVLEWVNGQSLEDFILRSGQPDRPLRATDQFKAILDTCRALCYLHSRRPPIIHGDLKGTNIIEERDPGRPDCFRAKLLDFGLARSLTRHAQRMGGTVMWLAPEIVQNPSMATNIYADIFSFGRLSFFVLTGIFPFRRAHKSEIIKTLKGSSLPPLPWPRVSPALLAQCRPWVEACSAPIPKERPSMPEIRLKLYKVLEKMGSEFTNEAEGFSSALLTEDPEAEDAGDAAAAAEGRASTPEAGRKEPGPNNAPTGHNEAQPPAAPAGPAEKAPEQAKGGPPASSSAAAARDRGSNRSGGTGEDAPKGTPAGTGTTSTGAARATGSSPSGGAALDATGGATAGTGTTGAARRRSSHNSRGPMGSTSELLAKIPRKGAHHSSSHSIARLPSVPERDMILPDFQCTPADTRVALLLDAVRRCNVALQQERRMPAPPEDRDLSISLPCCIFHTAVRAMGESLQELQKAQCGLQIFKEVRAQCPGCGLLLLEDDCNNQSSTGPGGTRSCAFCGHAMTGNELCSL